MNVMMPQMAMVVGMGAVMGAERMKIDRLILRMDGEERIAMDALMVLLNELDGFKLDTDFHFYGFGQGGPYAGWYKRASDIAIGSGRSSEAARNLITLGREYCRARGVETQHARDLRGTILEA